MHGQSAHLSFEKGISPDNINVHKEAFWPSQRNSMLGTVSYGIYCNRSSTTRLKAICRHPSPPNFAYRSGSRAFGSISCTKRPREKFIQLLSTQFPQFSHHSSSCQLARSGSIGGTIWHALLPSSHLSNVEQDTLKPSSNVNQAAAPFCTELVGRIGTCLFKSSCYKGENTRSFRRIAMATSVLDGSWNVALDARPARWLHGGHSAWLLFGVCSCFSAAVGASLPCSSHVEAEAALPYSEETKTEDDVNPHGKQVYKDYAVIGIPGDGRCLFRAVAHGACLRAGGLAPDESSQRNIADDLRNKVVDELVKRRTESEWFIEGDFDTYAKRMREPHVWGGEPELLMLSHVLKMPITVHISDKNSQGLIAIAEYGQEYGKENPIRVLFDGCGHYDALRIPGASSKL